MNMPDGDSTIITTSYDWATSGYNLTANDWNFIRTEAPIDVQATGTEINFSPLSCPVHGQNPNTLSFNFPEHGINEDYCLICLRDALRKILTPLNEGGGEIRQQPKEPGISISRYEIAKDS